MERHPDGEAPRHAEGDSLSGSLIRNMSGFEDGFPVFFDGSPNDQFFSGSGGTAGEPFGLFPPMWQSPVVKGRPPLIGGGRSADVIGSNKVYVFGGWSRGRPLNDLHVLQTDKMVWCQLRLSNTPPGRHHHATAVVGQRLFVHGGYIGGSCLNDLHVLDTATLTWTELTATGTLPSPRSHHTMNHVNNRLYLFGGSYDLSGSHCFNTIEILDLETQSWIQPEISGMIPEIKGFHSMTAVNESLILVGPDRQDNCRRGVYLFNTVTLTWTKPEVAGACPPKGLNTHSTTLVGDRLFVFGGEDGSFPTNQLYILDTTSFVWSNPQRERGAPIRRHGHSSFLVGGKRLFILGGYDGEKQFNDLHFLDVGRLTGDKLAYESVRNLLWSLKKMVGAPEFSDVTLVVEGRNIPVHRCILAALCDYFRLMFSGNYKESKQKQIVIHGWRYEPYMALLEFLYTGSLCKVQNSITCDVMGLSDMYGVDRLKALCENSLKHSVDSENVSSVLKHAEMYQPADLRKFCHNYILNHEVEISKAEKSEGLSDLPMERHPEGEVPRHAEDVPFSGTLTLCRSGSEDGFPAPFDGSPNELFFPGSGGTAGDSFGLLPPLWQSPDVKGCRPVTEGGHSTDVIGCNKVYVFGGWDEKTAVNDLLVLEMDKMVWHKLCLSDTPSKRYHHATAVVGLRLFVHGGNNKSTCLADLHVLDTATLTWTEFTATGRPPSPRYSHTMNHVNDKLYLFGGHDDRDNPFGCERNFGTFYILDLATQSWSEPRISGKIPMGRYSHSMTTVNTSLILVGSGTLHYFPLDDVYLFNTVKLTWTQPKILGDCPTDEYALFRNSATLVDDRLFVFVGCNPRNPTNQLFILDTTNFVWSNPQNVGGVPNTRSYYTSFLVGSRLFVLGGCDKKEYLNDLHFLDVGRIREDQVAYGSIRNLLWSLKNLVGAAEFSDVTFVVDGHDIPAHRCILAAQCDYFRLMFSGQWKESKQEQIVIPGWRYEPYMALLEFLYTGCLCKAQGSIIYDVMGLAHMYGLDRLKALCEDRLKYSVDSENVHSVLKHAEKYQSADLRKFCQKYILNHEVEISKAEESESLSGSLARLNIQ